MNVELNVEPEPEPIEIKLKEKYLRGYDIKFQGRKRNKSNEGRCGWSYRKALRGLVPGASAKRKAKK